MSDFLSTTCRQAAVTSGFPSLSLWDHQSLSYLNWKGFGVCVMPPLSASDLTPDNIALPQGGNVVKMILMWCTKKVTRVRLLFSNAFNNSSCVQKEKKNYNTHSTNTVKINTSNVSDKKQ